MATIKGKPGRPGGHVPSRVPLANGAGRIECSCGWKSRIQDDRYMDDQPQGYTGNALRDWEQHAWERRTLIPQSPEPPDGQTPSDKTGSQGTVYSVEWHGAFTRSRLQLALALFTSQGEAAEYADRDRSLFVEKTVRLLIVPVPEDWDSDRVVSENGLLKRYLEARTGAPKPVSKGTESSDSPIKYPSEWVAVLNGLEGDERVSALTMDWGLAEVVKEHLSASIRPVSVHNRSMVRCRAVRLLIFQAPTSTEGAVNLETKVSPERERADRSAELWREEAERQMGNVEYYRGLLDRIGGLFGVEARTANDGSVGDSILRAKVPELVEARIKTLESKLAAETAKRRELAERLRAVELMAGFGSAAME